jgi:hypothetical protein
MARKWREFLTAWDDYRVEADEYRELDEEGVLVALTAQGRGKASGLDIGAQQELGDGAQLSSTCLPAR